MHFGLVNRPFNHRFLTPLTPKFLSTIVFHKRKPPFKSSSTSSRFRGRHFRCHKGSECAIKSLHLLHVRIARPSVVTSNEANISSAISAGKTRTKSVMTSSLKSIARLATRLNLRWRGRSSLEKTSPANVAGKERLHCLHPSADLWRKTMPAWRAVVMTTCAPMIVSVSGINRMSFDNTDSCAGQSVTEKWLFELQMWSKSWTGTTYWTLWPAFCIRCWEVSPQSVTGCLPMGSVLQIMWVAFFVLGSIFSFTSLKYSSVDVQWK